jgi:uncharacterized protein (DUF2236 family)
MLTKRVRKQFKPHADNGFFGPGSVTWKVWSYPAPALVGFQRAVVVEELDPHLVQSVEDSGGVRSRPATRYDRTLHYFALVAFGDTATTAKAADILVKVHSKGIGHDPVTGRDYDANDPDSQLWIQVTGWHSILKSYQMFGGPKLSDAEIDQYWAECARAAELQTIDPADVPRSAAEVRAYYAKWRPDLKGTPLAQDMAAFILTPGRSFRPDLPKWRRATMLPVGHLVKWATISSYPAHIKELLGVRQSRVLDLIARVTLTPGFKLAHRFPILSVELLKLLSPSTVDVAAPILLGIPAEKQITMTPREAQQLYGYDEPAKAHLELRARQKEKVFGRGEAPSDEGIVESQAIIGTTDVTRVGQLA